MSKYVCIHIYIHKYLFILCTIMDIYVYTTYIFTVYDLISCRPFTGLIIFRDSPWSDRPGSDEEESG